MGLVVLALIVSAGVAAVLAAQVSVAALMVSEPMPPVVAAVAVVACFSELH